MSLNQLLFVAVRKLPRTLQKAEVMKGLPFVLAFTAMTFIAWGAYGPLLHHGTLSMGNDSLRAFVGVGIAYFFIAVLVPIYILRSQGEAGKWTMSGTFYSLFAGSVGALGALGVILALAYGGAPIYVMPLVFGFAPIVNTLVTAWMSKTFDQISPVFIGGIVVAALGVAGVLAFKPAAPPHAAHPTKDSKEDHDDKSAKKDHAFLNRRDSVRLVSSFLIQEPVQEPTSQDPLPPVVVQPPAPEPAAPVSPAPVSPAPEAPVVPQAEATQPKPAEQPAAAPDEPQELPPVVVQPVAPEPTTPASPTTPAPIATPEPTKTPVVQEPAPELPPAVVQPAPLKQADAPTTPAVEAPKTEPAQPEATKPESIKPDPKIPDPKIPEPTKPEAAKPEAAKPESTRPEPKAVAESATLLDEQIEEEPTKKADKPSESKKAATTPDVPMIILSIIVAAVCWGSYGPMLHQGQARMGGSRLRPFTCVGLAYFFIAVAAPLAVISARTADTGSWSVGGLSWSIVAGAAGAIGALGVILAFNAGGKPYYVMPLVFGFAPVINTCISLTEKGTWGLATPMFWISLAVVIAGAITVLLNAPKPKPHAKPAT